MRLPKQTHKKTQTPIVAKQYSTKEDKLLQSPSGICDFFTNSKSDYRSIEKKSLYKNIEFTLYFVECIV